MGLKGLFTITSIIAFLFAILFIIIPTQFFSQYGIESSSVLNYIGALFGASLIGIGLIAWQARNITNVDSLKVITFSFFIADGIGFIIALLGQVNNLVNNLGWLTVAIYLILSLAFAYYRFSKSVSK